MISFLLKVFHSEIYSELYEACSFSNADICGSREWMLGAGAPETIGRFCTCLYPHSHLNPIILPPRFILCHFLALHRMFLLWILHKSLASLTVSGA
jgi:hypothetical protein